MPRVFAIEPDRAQLTWRWGPHGPGVTDVGGLEPGSTVRLQAPGQPGRTRAVTVPHPPPGPERVRIAALSDLHLGVGVATRLGFDRTPQDPDDPLPFAVRCARSALDDAVAWGAQFIVLHGDLTHQGTLAQWNALGDAVARCPVPVVAMAGNHDLDPRRDLEPEVALRALGMSATSHVAHHDLPGMRVVLASTARAGTNRGYLDHLRPAIVGAVVDGGGPAVVFLHQQLQRFAVPTYLPRGVPGPAARRLLADLAGTGVPVTVVSGHTHRHRRRRVGPVTVVEHGATVDHPATWTGYVIHDGGLRQVVRRISDPVALRLANRTTWAAGGAWGLWAPGPRAHRCFTVRW